MRTARLTPRLFDRLLDAAPYVLIRLDRGPRVEIHPGVAEFFDAAYPGRFAFGVLARADVREAGWLERAFQTALGPVRGGVGDGYYLLEAGVVVGQHSGQIRPANVSYFGEHGAEQLRDRVRRLGFPRGARSESDLEAACQLVAYFDGIMGRKQQAADASGSRYVYEERESAPPPGSGGGGGGARPASSRAPAATDPYAVLGITREATDDEVKAAYREQLKLNHPDKVAHLSPALQEFATAQILAIKNAFDTIRKRRKG